MGARVIRPWRRAGIVFGLVIGMLAPGAVPAQAAQPEPLAPVGTLSLPNATCCAPAVWAGEDAYIFGGQWTYTTNYGHPSDDIVRYESTTNAFTTLPAALPAPVETMGPTPRSFASAVFDPSPRTDALGASTVCKEGCAYVFGGSKPSCTGSRCNFVFPAHQPTCTPQDPCTYGPEGSYLLLASEPAAMPLDAIVRFDAAAGTAADMVTASAANVAPARLIAPAWGTAAVWVGAGSQSVCPAGCAYIFGGTNGSTFHPLIQRFDPALNKVSDMGASGLGVLPAAMAHMSAVFDPTPRTPACTKGCAYLFGGYDGAHLSDDIVRYDPLTNTASRVGGLPSPRAFTAAAWDPLAGVAYVIGGLDPYAGFLKEVLRYDPATGSTTSVAWLPQALGAPAAAFSPPDGSSCPAGCVWVAGGDWGGSGAPGGLTGMYGPYSSRVLRLVLPRSRRETPSVLPSARRAPSGLGATTRRASLEMGPGRRAPRRSRCASSMTPRKGRARSS